LSRPLDFRRLVVSGAYRWDGIAGTFFFIDPKDDMFAICMSRHRSANGF